MVINIQNKQNIEFQNKETYYMFCIMFISYNTRLLNIITKKILLIFITNCF